MVQDAFIGTLTTLSLLVSPLSTGSVSDSTYRFELEPNALLLESCQNKTLLERSRMSLSIDALSGGYFTLGIKARVCAADFGARDVALSLNLPTEILDPNFIDNLVPGSGYVINGIPSLNASGRKERVKVTRLAKLGVLEPVRIEWIPEAGQEPAHHPLTIWMDPAPHAMSGVPGAKARALHWKKVSLSYRFPTTTRALLLNGDLKSIEASR